MAYEIARLRNEVELDASQYITEANEAAAASLKLGRASTEMGEKVQQTDVKIRGGAGSLDRLKRQIDPAHASAQKLKAGIEQLNRAFADNKDPQEHARLLELLHKRYDQVGQAAQRAAAQEAEAAVAAARAAARAAEETRQAQERQARELSSLRARYDEGYAAVLKYNTALEELARLQQAGVLSGKSLEQAQARIEAELNPANLAVRQQAEELRRLQDRLDPASVAARKLAADEETLRRAFERGTISGLEYDAMLRKLRGSHEDAERGVNRMGAALSGVLGEAADEAAGHLGFAGQALRTLGTTAGASVAGIAAAGVAIAALVAASIPAAGNFQKLEASLRGVSGNSQLAAAEFAMIKDFALDTTMGVEEVTKAFVQLKAFGLQPTMEMIRSLGNTSAVMNKTVEQMAEALADAVNGDFERLQEFGIKMKAEDDKVIARFNGVKTVIGNNAKEIQKYLLDIGNTKYATGLSEQSNTLSGAIENLSDNWSIFLANVGNSGPVQAATALINALAGAVEGLNRMLFPSIKDQIAATRGEVETLRAELAEMQKTPDAYGPEIEGRRKVLAERDKALASLVKEQAERDKLIAKSREQTNTEKELSEEEKKARERAAEAAKREAARRRDVTDSLDIEWDERNRILDATKKGQVAVERLNVELAGEKAIRDFLGTTNNQAAHQMMASNDNLAVQARRVQQVARASAELENETRRVIEAQKAAEQAGKEYAAAQTQYAEDVAEAASRMSEDVASDLFDMMTDPDREASVLEFMKNLFKRIAVEAAASQIILPIMTQVVGSAPSLFGVQAPPGGTPSSSINSPGFMNSASSMWSSMTGSGFGSQTAMAAGGSTGMAGSINAFGASAFGMAPGTVAAAPSAAFVGPMPMSAGTSSTLGGSTLMGSVGAGFGGAAIGGMVGSMIGNATGSRAVGAGSGALTGGAAGFMMGGPVGAAIGAIGGALMGALGTAGKPSNKEGNATYSMETGRTRVGGQDGDKLSQENRDAASKAAQAFGGIGELLGDFSGRKLNNSIRVVMGDRDGMSATMNGAKFSWPKRNDDAMRDMTKWFVDQFALQLGQDLPGDVRTALQRVDWRDVETALEDIAVAGTFRDKMKALKGDFGLIDEATESTRAEVKALTEGIIDFKATTARLGLDTAAANDATRSFVEGLLGMRAVAAPMNEAEAAVALLHVRFNEMAPLLREVGINADEAAKGLQRAIGALRDDFVKGLDREFNELRGAGWINQIDDTFAVMGDRLRSAAALGGGSAEVLRNNHQAIRRILEELDDEQLGEAAVRYGGNIAILAEEIKAARAVVEEAAPGLGQAVFDVVGFLKLLEREANETSGRQYINQITDQFAKMQEQLALAAKAGVGADIVLANNHRAMTNLLNGLNDPQLADAARTFGGGIDVIAQAILAARAAGQQAGLVAGQIFDVAGWLGGLNRSINQLQGNGYIDAITDQFAKMNQGMGIAAREGTGAQQVLTENHLAMVAILEDLTDEQLAAAAARFGGGIKAIADSLLAGRRATEAAAAAQEAATAAAEKAKAQAEAAAAAALDAANERVDRARDAVQAAYGREIDAQQELADAAEAASTRMRGFADRFRTFRQSLLSGDMSPLSPQDRYNTARSEFQDIAGRAAAGDADAMERLEAASQNFLQQSRAYYASSATYAADFQMVQAALRQAEASANQQASAADQALVVAKQQAATLQAQLDAINGTTQAVLTIPAAMAELTSALLAQARAGGGEGQNTNSVDLITAAYRQYLGRDPEAAGYAHWQATHQAGMSIGDVVNGIATSQEARQRAASGQTASLALMNASARAAARPANDTGTLTAATLHQTAAVQDGLNKLIAVTTQQAADIAELRAAERRRAAA